MERIRVTEAESPNTRRRSRWLEFGDAHPLVPYLYLLPHAIFFFVFIVYPILFGVWVSTHRWDPLQPDQPNVGLQYYRDLFDPQTLQYDRFWKTLVNTLFFVGVSTPLLIGVALLLAVQLQGQVWGRAFFRAVFFMPGILSVTVMAILWKWMFDNQSGLINVVRDQYLRLPTLPFLTTEWYAWIPIVIGTVWWTVGFNMTIYLAALGGISKNLYEAAELDGATSWQKFLYITWPLLQPTTLFIGVTTVLASFQLYGQSILITGGGPTRTTQSLIMYITEQAFSNNQFSSATAMAFMFGAIMLIFTVIQFRLMARDVKGSN